MNLAELLTTGLLVFAADPVQCTVPKAPLIEVVPKTAPTSYDFSKTIADLQTIKADTISPYGQHTEQLVYGLHKGKMSLGYNIEFGGMEYPHLNLACLYFNKVTVSLELNPVIYVVKEFRPGTCEHKAVLEHEKKHVATDRQIANKYAREIGVAVQNAVNRAGAIGPYYLEEIPVIRQRMAQTIAGTISAMELNLTEEQNRAQQAVDNREEYDSVSKKVHEVCRYKPRKRR
jgi:hypothetical protein